MKNAPKNIVIPLLRQAGIEVNGKQKWDLKVHDERFFARVFSQGSLGFGESFMDGWWDCEALDELITRIFNARLEEKVKPNLKLLLNLLRARLFNTQSRARAFTIGKVHYDIGNDLYRATLDSRMTYTCGYWKGANNLDEAQEAKLDLVCRKIGLKQGDHVLDIGCGWGSFAKFAAEQYGAKVTGITVSREQVSLGREMCKGLPVEIRLQDYREMREKFDHIVSLGMFEHVGYKNYRAYMEVARRCLRDDGLFLLHTIGGNRSVKTTDPWINKYIFPNSMLPSIAQIGKSIEKLFVMEDWHNFGLDYDKTLLAWWKNFDSHWDELKKNYNEKFCRMWKFYLLASAATFRARKNQLWQIVLSPHDVKDSYTSIR